MPLRESEAIILRSYSLGEADKLVSFLSRTMGRMRGVAQGARRPKSRFGSTLELLTYLRMWWYERETRELVRISQCEMIESFLEAQSDYQCGVALGLMSEVSEALLPEREAADASFRLLLAGARAVQRTRRPLLPLTYFSLWTVKLGGWLPDLARCSNCGRDLGGGAYGSVVRAGMRCASCRLPGFRSLPGESIALARQMFQEKLEGFDSLSPGAADGPLRDFMLDMIEYHAERKLNTRRMLEVAP